MIVGARAQMEVGFAAAQARLTNLMHGSWLLTASRDAYDEGVAGLARVGPLGTTPGLSRLVEVQVRDLAPRGDTAVLALRWQATGTGGALFPVLDGDITLSPDGDHATVLAMSASYRPPLGAVGAALDRAVLHRVAQATIGSLVGRIATAIAHPAPAPQPGPAAAEPQTSGLDPAAEGL